MKEPMIEMRSRGKDLQTGEWIIGYYREGDSFLAPCKGRLNNIKRHYIQNKEEVHEVDVATIGRATGVHDKNGKMVFDGDIVEMKTVNGKLMRGYVRYQVNCASFFIFTGGGTRFLTEKRVTVIGNIFDNQNLIS